MPDSKPGATALASIGNWRAAAAIAKLGERQTEDLKVPGSIPGLGTRRTAGAGARVRKLCRCHLSRYRSPDGGPGSLLSLFGAATSADLRGAPGFSMSTFVILNFPEAAIAQLGERETEDLKVPGSISGLGTLLAHRDAARWIAQCDVRIAWPCGLTDKALAFGAK